LEIAATFAVVVVDESVASLEERQQIHADRARLLLDSLHAWFKELLAKLSKKSEVTVAIHYALGRWAQLLRYVHDGGLEIGRVEMWRGGLGSA